ncbi:MAG: TonB-dependent receptor [Bacteroidia bacterium]|nr:TonB-dependent receptor [Bacteroidia bacterium]
MRKITQMLLVIAAFLFSASSVAQSTVTGTVVGSDLNAPLPGANVIERGTSNGASTDFDGNFSLNTEATSGSIVVSFVGYGSLILSFDGDTDFGTITLDPDNTLEEVVVIGSGVIDLAENRQTPIAVSTVTRSEIQEKAIGNVEVPEIIKNTPSVFVSGQTGFGDGQLFLRGFDNSNIAVLLNGQPVNAQEDGRIFWSNWAGVTDIANGVQVQRGLGSSKLAISSVGGTMNIVMKAADRNKGGFIRFMGGNDSYVKGTVAYDTGMNDKGWAFSVLLDHWQAHRKWSKGTFGQGQNYYFAVGYKPNDTHALNFLITGAPQFHGNKWSQRLSTLERDPKFNQHWGYTEGFDSDRETYTSEIDSERRNYYHKPVANLNWDWDINETTQLSSVLYASWGRGGGTGPRGDGRVRTSDGQVDYYGIEQQHLGDPDGIGNSGDYFILDDGEEEGNYIRRASVNNHQWYGLVSNLSAEFGENWDFNVGVDLRMYTGDHFRQIVDLYGLSGWANDNVDDTVVTATFDADPWAALSNFADGNERIDYDYSEDINYQGVFTQVEYATEKFSAFFQGALSNQSYQREGRFSDIGNSDKKNITGYNVKGGVSYNIENTHKLFANGGYYSRQPFLDNIFENIRRSNNYIQPDVENEDITGIELGYQLNAGDFKANINFYYTDWDNRTILSGGSLDLNSVPTPNDDSDDTDVNFFDRGVRQVHRGFELETFYNPSNAVRLNGYVSAGSFEYKGTIQRDIYNDDTGQFIGSEETNDLTGVKITTVPQFTAGLGARVRVTDGLSLDGNVNYRAGNYLDEIDFSDSSPQTQNVGRVTDYSITDLGLTYDFQLSGQELTFRANVFNVFDAVRLQRTDVFGYIFTNGRTYNASMRYRF